MDSGGRFCASTDRKDDAIRNYFVERKPCLWGSPTMGLRDTGHDEVDASELGPGKMTCEQVNVTEDRKIGLSALTFKVSRYQWADSKSPEFS